MKLFCFRAIPITLAVAAVSYAGPQDPAANPATQSTQPPAPIYNPQPVVTPAQTAVPIPQQVGASEALQPKIVPPGEVTEQTAPVPVASSMKPETGALTISETQFVQEAAEDARRIVQVAELARTRTANPKVASYAEKLASKDSSIMRQMQELGRLNGLIIAIEDDVPAVAQLSAMEGPEFDQHFVQQTLTGQEQLIAKFESAKSEIVNDDLEKAVAKGVSKFRDAHREGQKLNR